MYKLCVIIYTVNWYFLLSLGTVEGNCETANPPWVALTSGCVEGLQRISALGRAYYSFQGIPYAAPPVAELRFKAPNPVPNWSGVLRAVENPPSCLQPWRSTPYPITYSEDCLYLSVYTPYLQHPNGTLMPVIVWIHGGKYYQGTGSSYRYGPDFLLTKDVVVVNVNYRLGVFGYLNMHTSEAQGNAGMKDKVAALKWVQREILKFGGDPNSVTITGGSSGAGDVNYLYISPMAKGLFHKAISNSGAAICAWAFLPSTAYLGLALARALNCPSLTPEAIVTCLRAVNSTILAEKQMIFKEVEGLENPFVPTVETDLGEEVFLDDTPQNLISKAGGVPYIIGINNGEGLMFVKNSSSNPNQFINLEKDLISYLPVHVLKNNNFKTLQKTTSAIYSFYIGDNPTLNDTMYGFVNYMTDRQFGYCVLKTAQIISSAAPVYLYYFTFEGAFQPQDHTFKLLNISGVCHGDELGYLFYRNYSLEAHNNLSAYPRDLAMVEKMVSLWTDFAAYGNPTPKSLSNLNITWEPAEGTMTNHLVIGDTLEVMLHPLLEDRVEFWEDLYTYLLNILKGSIAGTGNNTIRLVPFLVIITLVLLGLVHSIKNKKQGYRPLK